MEMGDHCFSGSKEGLDGLGLVWPATRSSRWMVDSMLGIRPPAFPRRIKALRLLKIGILRSLLRLFDTTGLFTF